MEPTLILLILLSLLFSAFFSGMEIAFVSADKLQIELQNKQGHYAGKVMSYFLKYPSRYIGTTLVGNTLALVLYGVLMATFIDPFLTAYLPSSLQSEIAHLLIQTIISTLVVLALAEFIPKSLFMRNANHMLSIMAFPFQLLYYILFPFSLIVVSLSRGLIQNILGQDWNEERPAFGLTDLNQFINRMAENQDQSASVEVNTELFNNAIDFKTVRVRECLIPRTEIEAIDIDDGIPELQKAFIESGHSKILVYKRSIDDIIGYCHSLELFKKPKTIQQILTPVIIVPETMLANELMIQFISERKSLALVVDEFGGTSGIVTMEDIIEEIFGEIQDEHDDEDLTEEALEAPNTFLLSARLEVDYLNDKYGWQLPEGEYDTLGGLILSVNENLPAHAEIIEVEGFEFQIESMEDTRIENVRLTLVAPKD